MLSVGPDALRFSPSQNIPVKNEIPQLVMYITDRADTNKDGISADEFKVGCGKG